MEKLYKTKRCALAKGFSLIELAIVLVVLGLVVGGVLVGNSLIEAAQLRNVIKEYEKFHSATMAFKAKYNALPGDMPNATDIWGAAHPVFATCIVTPSVGTETCNGNGDGKISPQIDFIRRDYEQFRYFQQLSAAGLIAGGPYTGVTGPDDATHDAVIGENIPASKYPGAGWSIYYTSNATMRNEYFWGAGIYERNMYYFGAEIVGQPPERAVMTSLEAYSVDSKIDDGKPGSGTVLAPSSWSAYAPNCSTTNVADTALYKIQASGRVCSLNIKASF